MYADHYFPNMTKKERHANEYHNRMDLCLPYSFRPLTWMADHCLDMLRQSIQCAGDTSLLTMKWQKKDRIPTGNFTSSHTCVNWERLDHWAEDRWVDVMKPGYLVHPTLGAAFPKGRGNRIGEALGS